MLRSGWERHARLSGWLIPVQILMWWMLIGTLLYVGGTIARLMPGGAYAANMESGAVNATWRFMIQFELASNALLIVFIAILLVQLYKRKRSFRTGAVALLIVILALSLIVLGVAYYADALHGAGAAQLWFKALQNCILALVGILYLARSKRVKRTFVF
ncbi:DUF2569 family protein [Paenibacillus methanolicus]|uniref:Uncharacterized protein DUF2569 n=1 Tax=Paenibacillus methanolicus TaxID=582686 RepID=A0A5S5C2M9_9BACL|nr:DUF2569 family protein [Paenibacillus methanolicus]TYP72732.1 uncharacterized protein DUF2569 [Paenibacillus methanolicus]